MTKKESLIQNTEICLEQAIEAMRKNLVRAVNSSAIDVDSYDTDHNSMVLPKAILCALLENESGQFDLSHTSFKKEFLADKKNIKLFI